MPHAHTFTNERGDIIELMLSAGTKGEEIVVTLKNLTLTVELVITEKEAGKLAWALKHAVLCRQYSRRLIEPLREKANELGYALAVHGSLLRDIDLIAVPWTLEAVPARELAMALKAVVAKHNNGVAEEIDHIGMAGSDYFHEGCPGAKPHSRLVWSFHLGGGPYIDLSVMQPAP